MEEETTVSVEETTEDPSGETTEEVTDTGSTESDQTETSGETEVIEVTEVTEITEINVQCECPDYSAALELLLQELQAVSAGTGSLQQQLETQDEQQTKLLTEWKAAVQAQNDAVNAQFSAVSGDMKMIIALLLVMLCMQLRRLAKEWKKTLFGGVDINV